MKKNRHQEQADDAERIARQQASEPDSETTVNESQAAAAERGPVTEGQAETAPASETESRLAKCEADFKELSDRYLRLMAEYDNFRKRTQKEREALYADSVIAVVKEWLPVIDNLDRAEQAAQAAEGESARRIADGVLLILKQVSETLNRLSVQEIDCLGQTFDPGISDAVMHVEDDSVGPSTVVEVLQKGYRRDERVIRHSMVKVAN